MILLLMLLLSRHLTFVMIVMVMILGERMIVFCGGVVSRERAIGVATIARVAYFLFSNTLRVAVSPAEGIMKGIFWVDEEKCARYFG